MVEQSEINVQGLVDKLVLVAFAQVT